MARQIKNQTFEAAIGVVTSAVIAWALLLHGAPLTAPLALLLLNAAALTSDYVVSSHLRILPYNFRPADACGLTLGSLTLPWVASSMFAVILARSEATDGGVFLSLLVVKMTCTISACISVRLIVQVTSTLVKNKSNKGSLHAIRWSATLGSLVMLCGVIAMCMQGLVIRGAGSGMKSAGELRRQYPLASMPFLTCVGIFGAYLHHQCTVRLPRTFTIGECIIAVTGATTVCIGAAMRMPHAAGLDVTAIVSPIQSFIIWIIFGSGILCYVEALQLSRGRFLIFASISILAAALAFLPAVWLIEFICSSRRRMLVILWWMVLMLTSLPAMHSLSRWGRLPNIIVRKGYHALAVALFVPALMTEPDLLAMAMAGAFAALMVIETLRVSHTPVLGEAIQRFMGPFTDARDSGTLFVTHFALLLGLAVPIWLFVALKEGFALKADIWPPAFAGIVMTGIGDAIASIVGSQWGRIPMAEGTNKTVEGTAAGAIASLASWCLLSIFSDGAMPPLPWLKLAVVTALSSLLEAVTSQLDNLVVPLHYFALVVLL